MDESGRAVDPSTRRLNVGRASVNHDDFCIRQQVFKNEQRSWEKSASDNGHRADRK